MIGGLPACLVVAGRSCLVLGGGAEAARHGLRLLTAGGQVTVVSPRPAACLQDLIGAGARLHQRHWRPDDLDGTFYVVATREDPVDAGRLWDEAGARGALVTVLDDPAHCTVTGVSTVTRGPVQVAVSTSGRAPALAAALRRRLESWLGPEVEILAEIVAEVRASLLPQRPAFDEWAGRWRAALDDLDVLLDRIRDGDVAGVTADLRDAVGGADPRARAATVAGDPGCRPGVVHLVGAGPGDPGLLTVRAATLLRTADVVAHDQLVPPAVLARVRPGAELVPVGRRRGKVIVAHDAVVDLLEDAARGGRRVVRLKGGDPMVFGRGGEEVADLMSRGIEVEVVPGVTSAVAAPELAGIPLTHRDHASGFLVVTAEERPGKVRPAVDWDLAARFDGTLVVLMGVGRWAEITRRLIDGGRAAATPAAVVQGASTPAQRSIGATLETIAAVAAAAGIGPPAVLVVGDVVHLRRDTVPAERPAGSAVG